MPKLLIALGAAVAAFALLQPATAAPPGPPLPFQKDLQAAQKDAKTLRLPVLVVLTKAKATVPTYTDARILDKASAFACASVALTPALAKQYDLEGEFHILIISSDGEVLEKYGADVTADKLWPKMNALGAEARAAFLKTLRSDADAKEKKAALAGLVRVGVSVPDLFPLLAGPPGEARDAARKALAALPTDAVVAALLDGLKSEDAEVRAAAHSLAVQVTGYKGAPLKVFQSGTAEERAAAWDKWNDAAQSQFYALNRCVIAYCEKHMDEQVSNGECAMLVIEAYKECKARPMVHSGSTYVWGRPLRPGEPVLPGDVVQFEGAKVGNFTYPHHTSVIHKVLGSGKYEVLEQNIGGIKKVRPGKFDINTLKEGSIVIYRPQPK